MCGNGRGVGRAPPLPPPPPAPSTGRKVRQRRGRSGPGEVRIDLIGGRRFWTLKIRNKIENKKKETFLLFLLEIGTNWQRRDVGTGVVPERRRRRRRRRRREKRDATVYFGNKRNFPGVECRRSRLILIHQFMKIWHRCPH